MCWCSEGVGNKLELQLEHSLNETIKIKYGFGIVGPVI